MQEEWASTSTQVRRRQSPRAPWLLALSEGSLLLGKVDNLLELLGSCILGSRNQLGRLEKVGEGWRGWEKVGEGWRRLEKVGEGTSSLWLAESGFWSVHHRSLIQLPRNFQTHDNLPQTFPLKTARGRSHIGSRLCNHWPSRYGAQGFAQTFLLLSDPATTRHVAAPTKAIANSERTQRESGVVHSVPRGASRRQLRSA